MIRRFAAAALFITLFVMFLWGMPVQAQGDPTPTNTPRPTPTNEGGITPTHTPTATTIPPTATATQPPTTGGGGSTEQTGGSIRGTVYEDKNSDGKCVGQNEPALSGIVVQFVSNDGQTTVFLESGSDGSYGLVAAGLGTWSVKAIPPAGYSVSSEETRSVFLSEAQRVATGVDFCIRKGAAAPGPSVLPASGSLIAAPILTMTLAGIAFIFTGAIWQVRHLWLKRRSS